VSPPEKIQLKLGVGSEQLEDALLLPAEVTPPLSNALRYSSSSAARSFPRCHAAPGALSARARIRSFITSVSLVSEKSRKISTVR
jgi:hypothetical protein